MRIISISAACFVFLVGVVPLTGCGGNEATVAPRTEEEIQEMEQMIYGAEEEDQEDSQAAEEDN